MRHWEQLRREIPGALSVAEMNALAIEASMAKGGDALEVGHYKGLSTAVLLQSLPETMALWTIDHHQGDEWCSPTESAEFEANIAGYVGARPVTYIYNTFEEGLALVPDGLRFVFYDADHSVEASRLFWGCVAPKLAQSCVILVDDCDWDGPRCLVDLAVMDGFNVAPWTGSEYRGAQDKSDPRTNTMEVLIRE